MKRLGAAGNRKGRGGSSGGGSQFRVPSQEYALLSLASGAPKGPMPSLRCGSLRNWILGDMAKSQRSRNLPRNREKQVWVPKPVSVVPWATPGPSQLSVCPQTPIS